MPKLKMDTVTNNRSPDEWKDVINAFFDALRLQQLEQCEAHLALLETWSCIEPALESWCRYFKGILAFEIQRNWAKAEQIFTELLQTELEPELCGRVTYALGRSLDVQGRWQEAVDAFQKCSKVADELEQPIEQAKAWKHIAISYRKGFDQGDFGADVLQQALENCDQALKVLNTLPDPASDILWEEGTVHTTLGLTYASLRQWHAAIQSHKQALAICCQLKDRFGIGLAYGNLAEAYQNLGPMHWSQANAFYTWALALIREFDDRYEEVEALTNLGSLYQAMKRYSDALEQYTQAIKHIESLRLSSSSEEARIGFFGTVLDTYARAVQVCYELGNTTLAFDIVERARARVFVEMLGQEVIRPSRTISISLLHEDQVLRNELHQLYRTAGANKENIVKLESALNRVQRKIRTIDAEYAAFHTVHPLTHEQMQARLPASVTLLAYFIARDRLFAFVITQDELTLHALPFTPQDLDTAFDIDGHLLHLTPSEKGTLHPPWLLEGLYQGLIAPLSARLAKQQILCIVPHGSLHYIPFHALAYQDADGVPRTLLDDHEILYAPSATVLLEYCQRKQIQAPEPGVALGYNGTDLHHAEAEAVAVAKCMSGIALVADKATQQALHQHGAHARWIHFACHGRFKPHAPLTSHLLLADHSPLYMADVLQKLDLQADLVTLSACETGRSRVLKGDELIGLVRAFMYAGTPSVLVSLWPVDEISTRILMEAFYKELLAGTPKARALRMAQQHVRNLSARDLVAILGDYGDLDPEQQVARLVQMSHNQQERMTGNELVFAHPYFWAPFILVGDRLHSS